MAWVSWLGDTSSLGPVEAAEVRASEKIRQLCERGIETRAYVYRVFNANEVLLYVGKSVNLLNRADSDRVVDIWT